MTTYYIDPGGDDSSGDGSSGNPWQTISKAHTAASAGDTIICNDGTYTLGNQTFSKNLTIEAANDGLAILDGSGGNVAWTFNAGTYTVTGLVLQDVARTSGGGIIASQGGATTIVTWQRCRFSELVCYGNVFLNNGVFSFANPTGAWVWTFNNCVFDDPVSSDSNPLSIFNVADPLDDNAAITIINCSFYLPTTGGAAMDYIYAANYAGDVALTIKNSIIYAGSSITFDYLASSATTTVVAANNCYYNMTAITEDANPVSGDPLFVDAANDNFNLRPASPARWAGVVV